MSKEGGRELNIFTDALEVPASERATFVARACAGDEELRAKVQALLLAYGDVGDFLESPPPGMTTREETPSAVGEKPGDRIGHYKLLQQIGEGGWGVVYMAEQKEPVRRRVALKIIKPGMDTKNVIARFEAERQALALMNHPNIAKVFDAGATASGRPYFVMELVRGTKITEFCDQNALTTRQRLEIFIQVCRAVQHAHQKGIIHRDIKPSNILVTTTVQGTPSPVIIDFGIAKATSNQRLTDKTLFTSFEMLIGTPAYMSPEQAVMTSVDVDTRTDIYSLGVLLYELLTGSPPFDAGELLKAGLDEVRRVIREQEPVRPSTRLSRMTQENLTTVAERHRSEPPRLIRAVKGDLDWIVMKAMEKDRTRRYETANGLALDVERFLADEPVSARPPSAIYQFEKLVSRNKFVFIALGVIAALLVVSLIIVTVSLAREMQAHRDAKATLAVLQDMLKGIYPSYSRGRNAEMMEDLLNETAQRLGTDLTNQPAVEADVGHLIGRAYLDIGQYGQAEGMLRKAVAIRRQLDGDHSAKLADCLYDLGQACWREANLPEAEKAHTEALAIRERLFATNTAVVAASMNAVGQIWSDQRKLTEAMPLILQGLEIRRRLAKGGESLDVAESLRTLSVTQGAEGKTVEAEETARELVNMRLKLLPSKYDRQVAEAYNMLQLAAGQNGKRDAQEEAARESLDIYSHVVAMDHPFLIKSIADLGEIMRLRGDTQEAHAVLLAAISIQRKLLGDDYPDTLSSLGSLGQILESEGKWAEAESIYQQILAAWRRRAGNEYPHTLWALGRYANALTVEGKLDQAKQALDETLTPKFAENPASSELLQARLVILARQGRWQEAASDQALLLKDQPDDHYNYHRLAALLIMSHDLPAYQQLCAKILSKFTNTTDPYTAERMAGDCLALADSGVDLQAVDQLAERAVSLGSGSSDLPYFEACKALSSYRLGRFGEAIQWANKAMTPPSMFAQAKAYGILAMSYWKLGEKSEAQAMLAKGNELAPPLQLGGKGVDLGDAWVARVFARIALDEAGQLIQPGATGNNL